jgi:hypothetical protein
MFSMPMKAISERIRAVVARSHNMPEDMRKADIEAELERNWKEVMGKAENYVQGENILRHGGHFSTMSLGNWDVLCAAAGVAAIPSRLACVVNPVFLFDTSMNGLRDGRMEEMQSFLGGFQSIEDDEIVRFDSCASSGLKAELTLGRASGAIPDNRGYTRKGDINFPDFQDERIIEQMMEDPQNQAPVWIRKWTPPVMMEGDATAGYRAAVLPGQPGELAEDETLPEGEGTLFPCEWRVFVKNGEVQAVGNYYPQISRGTTPEDEEIALSMVAEARNAARRLIDQIKSAEAIPHHPRYELRDGFDPDGIHFSLDFLEVADDEAPLGRRLVMIEGGPAHLRGPNWGAHPVSFGTSVEPSGIALSLSDIRSLDNLEAL